jgi:Glycosyltransferase
MATYQPGTARERVGPPAKLVCLLDKADPPHHSFVDGMLATALPRSRRVRVILVVSGSGGSRRPYRYRQAICVPSLWQRRGFGRFLNYFLARAILERVLAKRGRISVLVRNDPVLLTAAASLRRNFSRLLFQSSHPHEDLAKGVVKRQIARYLFRGASPQVDALLAVSPPGIERMRTYFTRAESEGYIPLLAEPIARMDTAPSPTPISAPLKIIYIGSHSAIREVELSIAAFGEAVRMGANAQLTMVGAAPSDLERLRAAPGVRELEEASLLHFVSRVTRPMIPPLLAQADVGSCLIAPHPGFREMSPTKLAEYMACGLAVIGTKGIPMQEKFITDSGGGILTDWSISSISSAIYVLAADRNKVEEMKKASLDYARTKLQYSHYVDEIVKLSGISDAV